jgi:ABC-type transport system involved in cytochrome bd biosynthesis fused ATPase/permease subunit
VIPREIRAALAIGALIILLIFIVLALSWCSERERRQQAGNERDMARGRTTSAVEAITEIGKLEDRGQATDTQVEEATNAILQAAPADRDRVARARLCQLQQRPDCDRVL